MRRWRVTIVFITGRAIQAKNIAESVEAWRLRLARQACAGKQGLGHQRHDGDEQHAHTVILNRLDQFKFQRSQAPFWRRATFSSSAA